MATPSACDVSVSTTAITACSTPPCWYRKKVVGTATANADRLPLNIFVPPDACQTSGAYLQAIRLPLNVSTGFAPEDKSGINNSGTGARIAPPGVGLATPGISRLCPTCTFTYQYDQWTVVPAPDCLNPFNGTIVPATTTLTYYTSSAATSPPGCATQPSNCLPNAGFSPPIPSAASATCGASCINPFTSAPVSVGTPLVSYAASTAAVCTAIPSTCTPTAGFSPAPGPASSCLVVINGLCGTARGIATASAPTSGLCSAGSTSAVTGTGPFNWTCGSVPAGAGTADSCTAPSSASGCHWVTGVDSTHRFCAISSYVAADSARVFEFAPEPSCSTSNIGDRFDDYPDGGNGDPGAGIDFTQCGPSGFENGTFGFKHFCTCGPPATNGH